jgi:S-adenosylmethionine decarboxylase
MKNHFGVHLTLDGYGGDEALLNDQELVQRSLDELPTKLDMHQLAPPQVYFAAGNDTKDPGGWTGFVVIEESHISVHTFPKKKFVSIDVYTCQNEMDKETVVAYFTDLFKLTDVETNYIIRGTRYMEQ